MIFQNIKTFFKQLNKNRLYSFVTIFGFSTSLMFVILLSVYIKQELSVDKFHVKKDMLYRLVNEDNSNFGATIGAKIQNAFPEIESHTRTFNYEELFSAPGFSTKKINADLLMVDSTFFTMFSFNLLAGDPSEVLKLKNSVVVTQHFSRGLFGGISPLGKEIKSSNGTNLIITGIVDEFPQNTQFNKCDAVVNFQAQADFWGYPQLLTTDNNSLAGIYFLTKPKTNIVEKETQALELLKKDFWMYRDERVKTLGFEPITESYFSNKKGDIKQNSKTLISVLSVIILLILILSIINYINLTIAQSGFRNKEIAIRKLMGGSRSSLLRQYISESVLLCFIAFGIGAFFSIAAEPIFNNLLETNIELVKNIAFRELLIMVSAILIIGIISGVFPALILTGLNPADVVKGSFQKKNKSTYSKVLVSFQFAATIALIICSWTIVKQTNFIRNYDLGFSDENIIQIKSGMNGSKKQTFRDILHQIPGVNQVSFVAGSPFDGGNNQSFKYDEKPVSFQEFIVDSAFFSMMDIKYTQTGVAWSENVLWLNKTTVKQLNLEPLPESFKRYDEVLPVYGIMEDFHFKDLRQPIGLAMIRPMKDKDYPWSILVKISGANIPGTLASIKSEFEKFTGGTPFDFQFADSTFENWYKKEVNTSKIIGYFSVLAIIISVMGILALVTYYNQLRIKEIGIRKVNGAKISEILTMLNKDFIKWVAIAFVVACPIAYYAMNKWLENFAYKTTLSWWIFALAGLMALGIALLTVSWQSWRAANRNPVESLRYE